MGLEIPFHSKTIIGDWKNRKCKAHVRKTINLGLNKNIDLLEGRPM